MGNCRCIHGAPRSNDMAFWRFLSNSDCFRPRHPIAAVKKSLSQVVVCHVVSLLYSCPMKRPDAVWVDLFVLTVGGGRRWCHGGQWTCHSCHFLNTFIVISRSTLWCRFHSLAVALLGCAAASKVVRDTNCHDDNNKNDYSVVFGRYIPNPNQKVNSRHGVSPRRVDP
jgi:hypothetical protein